MQRSQLIAILSLMVCFGIAYGVWRGRAQQVFRHEGPGRAFDATAVQVYDEGVPVTIADQQTLAEVVALIGPEPEGWERQFAPLEGVFRFALLREGDASVPFELGEGFIVSGVHWKKIPPRTSAELRALLIRHAKANAPAPKRPAPLAPTQREASPRG